MLLILSRKIFSVSFNTFLTAGSFAYSNPRGLVFVVLILSTLILSCYNCEHNLVYSQSAAKDFCKGSKKSLAEVPLSFGGLQSFWTALEMPELNISYCMNKTYGNGLKTIVEELRAGCGPWFESHCFRRPNITYFVLVLARLLSF